jgi:serine/threonine-protein kinase RsbW
MAVAGSNRQGDSDPPAGGRRGGNGRRGGRRGGSGSGGNGGSGANGRRGGQLSFEINSDLSEGREVQRQILELVESCGYAGATFFAVNLALEEALVNAIKHGNRLDPKKKVRVEAVISPDKVEIFIEDEGPGFDRSSVPDPTIEENLEKCSGRGILLIEAYMTEVSWDRGGRRLRMVKVNQPDNPAHEH